MRIETVSLLEVRCERREFRCEIQLRPEECRAVLDMVFNKAKAALKNTS